MVKLVDDEKLQRLVRIGRERGAVTIDDLRAALPVELMTPAELAEAVERLEDAGVPVELEGWLSRPAPGGAESPIAGAVAPAALAPDDATPSTRTELRAPAPPIRAPDSTTAPTGRSRPTMTLGIAIVVLLVVVAILLLLSVA